MPSVWWTVVLKFQMNSPRFIASKASVRSCESMLGALSCVNFALFPCHGNSKEIMVAPDREYILIVIQECFVAKWRKAMILKSDRNRTSNIVCRYGICIPLITFVYVYTHCFHLLDMHLRQLSCVGYLVGLAPSTFVPMYVHIIQWRAFKQDRFSW